MVIFYKSLISAKPNYSKTTYGYYFSDRQSPDSNTFAVINWVLVKRPYNTHKLSLVNNMLYYDSQYIKCTNQTLIGFCLFTLCLKIYMYN